MVVEIEQHKVFGTAYLESVGRQRGGRGGLCFDQGPSGGLPLGSGTFRDLPRGPPTRSIGKTEVTKKFFLRLFKAGGWT